MSSTSTTWTTDTNTKSGVVQIYSSNVSVLKVVADEGENAILDLFADEGDDNADKWRLWVNASDDDLHFSNYTSGTAWTDILTLQDGGNVGIGTDAPEKKLHIAHDSGTTEYPLMVENPNISAGARTGILFEVYDQEASIEVERGANDQGLDMRFLLSQPSSDTKVERLTILESGNVGIGTNAPASLLHLDSSGGPTLQLSRTSNSTSGTLGEIQFGVSSADTTMANIAVLADGANDSAKITFGTQTASGANTTRMVINSTGDVNFGTATAYAVSYTPTMEIQGTAPALNITIDADDFLVARAIDAYADLMYDDSSAFRIGTAAEPDSTSFAAKLTILAGGNVGIGETAPDALLTLNQAALDTAILSMKSSDVTHGVTTIAETDTYGVFLKNHATNGGMRAVGIADTGNTGLEMRGICVTAETTLSTSANAAVTIDGALKDGTGIAASGTNANILAVKDNTTTRFIIDAEGDVHYDGATGATAWDNYNDAQLVRTLDLSHGKNIISNKFDEFIDYNHEKLAELKLVGREKDGTPNHFINITGLQRLHNGAIWQQYTEMQKMKELMYETMVELMGKEKADKKLNSHDIKLLDKDLLN